MSAIAVAGRNDESRRFIFLVAKPSEWQAERPPYR
jgi:hypothetical protein